MHLAAGFNNLVFRVYRYLYLCPRGRAGRQGGRQGGRGKGLESKEKRRGEEEERMGKRKEAGARLEKSGRGSRLVERALRERN